MGCRPCSALEDMAKASLKGVYEEHTYLALAWPSGHLEATGGAVQSLSHDSRSEPARPPYPWCFEVF